VTLRESVGDVLEKDQAERDVLILRRVHVPAHLIRRLPECGLETEARPITALGRLLFAVLCHVVVRASFPY
jgi:hypothetical protein